MPENLKEGTLDEKMDYLSAELKRVMDAVGFSDMVFILRVDGDRFIAARFPTCTDDCPSPSICTAKVFAEAAADLNGQAAKILSSNAVRESSGVKKGGFLQ